MRYIASCSGGKDSVATLILAKENGEPLHEVVYCEVMFDADTSGEVPEHREFIYNKLKPYVENIIGVPFIVLRSKKTYLDVFRATISRGKRKGKIRGFAIPTMCAVNRDCKIPPIKKYWKDAGCDVVQYVGIAADEPQRLARLKGNMVSLLNKYGITEHEAMNICEKYGLRSPIYDYSTRNGCWFCPNASESELQHMVRNHPVLFDRLVNLEIATENIYRTCLTRTETPSQIKARILASEQLNIFDYLQKGG